MLPSGAPLRCIQTAMTAERTVALLRLLASPTYGSKRRAAAGHRPELFRLCTLFARMTKYDARGSLELGMGCGALHSACLQRSAQGLQPVATTTGTYGTSVGVALVAPLDKLLNAPLREHQQQTPACTIARLSNKGITAHAETLCKPPGPF